MVAYQFETKKWVIDGTDDSEGEVVISFGGGRRQMAALWSHCCDTPRKEGFVAKPVQMSLFEHHHFTK